MTIRINSLVLILASAIATPVSAQSGRADSTAIRISASIRDSGPVVSAIPIFRQQSRKRSTIELRAVADSLVAIVLSPAVTTAAASRQAHLIVELKMSAAATDLDHPGLPSTEAGDGLFRIAQSRDTTASVYATSHLADIADKRQAIRYLRTIAASNGGAASVAMRSLAYSRSINDTGGLLALKELWQSSAVTSRNACLQLSEIAAVNSWPAVPQSSCKVFQ